MLCRIFHYRHRPSENVKLLFQLLRVFTIRHVPDFHFLKKFLDEDVAKVNVYVSSYGVIFMVPWQHSNIYRYWLSTHNDDTEWNNCFITCKPTVLSFLEKENSNAIFVDLSFTVIKAI